MQIKSRYRKLAAFIPAIAFVVPLIAYRAGAFDRFTKPTPEPAATTPAPVEGNWESVTDQQMFMYSSKSAPPFSPTASRPPAPTPSPVTVPSENPPTFMGGSKSKGIFSPVTGSPTGNPAPNAPAP